MVLCKVRSWHISQENQIGFEQMVKLSINLLIFSMGKAFLYRHYWPWIKLPTPYQVNLQHCIFLNGINHWLFVFFLPMLIFLKVMHSQNDETGILEVLEIKFSSKPNHGGQILRKFFKTLSVDFTLSWWHLCNVFF